jgi:DNA polymerase III sliding clamp (beta) subunit (PCNA family)
MLIVICSGKEVIQMEIQVHKLRNALGLLEGLASPKAKTAGNKSTKGRGGKSSVTSSTFPVLSNILLRDGKATATDMETAVTVDLPEVAGECLLPFDRVTRLLKYVNGNDELKIEPGKRTVTLSWSEGKATLETESIEDYPQIPQMEPVLRCSVLGDMLVPSLLSMLDYCATDSSRPVLAGVSLFLGEPLEIAAGDGYRMAYKTLSLPLAATEGIKTVVIPSKAVVTLGHVWSKAPRPQITEGSIADLVATKGKIELEISPTLLRAQFGVVSLLVRTVAGTPPSFKQLIPADPPHSVQFYAPDFEVSLRRLMGTAKEGNGAVRMAWADGSMALSTEDRGSSHIEVSMPAQALNGSGRIAINMRYLQEYVKGKSGLVTMGVTTVSGPALFRHGSSPLVVIMPMNVSWPDDQVETPVEPEPAPEPPGETSEDAEEGTGKQVEEETVPVD